MVGTNEECMPRHEMKRVQIGKPSKAKKKKKKKKLSPTTDNAKSNLTGRMDPSATTVIARPLPFTGKLMAVSSLAPQSFGGGNCDGDGTGIPQEDASTYNSISTLCQTGGAQCCSQVHKRVFCLVATPCAIRGRTQRVRKAWKHGIPVITVDWVRVCVREGKLLSWNEYRVTPPGNSPKTSATT